MPGPSPGKFSPLLFSMPGLDYKVQLAPFLGGGKKTVVTPGDLYYNQACAVWAGCPATAGA